MLLRKEVRISVPPCGNTEGAATTAEKPGVAVTYGLSVPRRLDPPEPSTRTNCGSGWRGVVLVTPSVEAANPELLAD